MKQKTDLSLGRMIVYGLITEIALVVIQVIYAQFLKTGSFQDLFSSAYMRESGFMIFQIVGFFVYVLAGFLLLRKIQTSVISKMIAFLLTGAVIELAFYLSVQAPFDFLYIFSIIDKLPAVAWGSLLYYFADRTKPVF